MGDFLSLGSLKCSNIASYKGTCGTKVACGHIHKENCGGSECGPLCVYFYIIGYF